jgi:glycosyl transferase family (putative galactosyltransferase)
VKALCSIGSGAHEALLEISRPTFAAYAHRHGYELITSTASAQGRPPAWSKVPMLREALASYDLALWIDADAVIVDDSRDIADELAAERFLGLVRHGAVPNTGVMLLRACDAARDLLDRTWDATGLINHPWWENAALLDVLGYDLPEALEPGLRGRAHRLAARLPGREQRRFGAARPSRFKDATQFLPLEWNSVYLHPAERPRIVHCLGVPVEQRMRDMRAALGGFS